MYTYILYITKYTIITRIYNSNISIINIGIYTQGGILMYYWCKCSATNSFKNFASEQDVACIERKIHGLIKNVRVCVCVCEKERDRESEWTNSDLNCDITKCDSIKCHFII